MSQIIDAVAVVPKIGVLPYRHTGYQRGCDNGKGCVFGPSWKDPADTSGCNTRERVLARDLSGAQTRPAPGRGKCRAHVIGGHLADPYTGTVIDYSLLNPSAIQIDHVYPEHRAWDAGAADWEPGKRYQFANDMRNLLAVSGKANTSKGDRGPGTWMPPNPSERCPYVRTYVEVAFSYGLPIDTADKAAALKACS